MRIPDHLSYEEAATLPCAAVTAWNGLYGLKELGFKAGETLVAQGTGGVSVFGLQFGLAAGGHVVITSSSDEKLETVRKLVPQDVANLALFLAADDSSAITAQSYLVDGGWV